MRPAPAQAWDFEWFGEDVKQRVSKPGWFVYVTLDVFFRILYVGMTRDPVRRLNEHRLGSAWAVDGWFSLVDGPFESQLEAADRERELIRLHRPPNNTQHNPAPRRNTAKALAQAADAISAVARELEGARS